MRALKQRQFIKRERTRETREEDRTSAHKLHTLIKRYLECHLAHKDGSKDVVGDGEKDSFL